MFLMNMDAKFLNKTAVSRTNENSQKSIAYDQV